MYLKKSASELEKLAKVPGEGQEMASITIEPPAFISETRSYAEYKADLKLWSRITTLAPDVQAEMVVYRLAGHSSGIKEKIQTQIGEKLEGNKEGMNELIKFLDTIYAKDDMSDAWQKYNLFTDLKRKENQDIMEFISEWNNCLHKANKAGCEFSDVILGFKLLRDANLKEIESNLVLTGVDFQTGKDNEDLLEQVTNSLKKFKGRKNIVETDKNAVATESVLIIITASTTITSCCQAQAKP